MSRSNRTIIKLHIKTHKQLNQIVPCSVCDASVVYKDAYFYVDESNVAITNNSNPVCINCKINNT
jgi:hypothetical protein